jgi:hypothetical protein
MVDFGCEIRTHGLCIIPLGGRLGSQAATRRYFVNPAIHPSSCGQASIAASMGRPTHLASDCNPRRAMECTVIQGSAILDRYPQRVGGDLDLRQVSVGCRRVCCNDGLDRSEHDLCPQESLRGKIVEFRYNRLGTLT